MHLVLCTRFWFNDFATMNTRNVTGTAENHKIDPNVVLTKPEHYKQNNQLTSNTWLKPAHTTD